MNRLIEAALRNRVAANLLALFLVIAGAASMGSTTVRLLPDIELEAISITVPYPGATPNEVEEGIVEPIERQIEGLEGVRKVTSLAAQDVGNIIVALDSGEDIDQRLSDIETEIDQITVFPRDAEDPRITEVEADELTVQVLLHETASRSELKAWAERMRTALIDVPAISDVRVEAVGEDLIEVEVEQATLQRYGFTLNSIAERIAASSLDLSAGEIEGDDQRLLVRSLGERETGSGIETVVIGTGESGAIIRVGDIARVRDGLDDSPIQGSYRGGPAVVLSVYRVGDEQVFDRVEATREVLENEIQPRLPAGVTAEIWRDESTSLSSRIRLLIENALIGVTMVFILLLLFLDIRVAGWVAVGVGVAFIGSFALLKFAGITIN